jgi:hypothetical protein
MKKLVALTLALGLGLGIVPLVVAQQQPSAPQPGKRLAGVSR